MMSIMITVMAPGQVTLHREVLEHLGAEPGDRLEVELLPGGTVEVKSVPLAGIEGFFGCLKSPLTRTPSIDEMNQVIADAWSEQP
jgi:antitoxin PrlF